MPKRIKIKDIALRAGVSTGTVDRVIHKRGRVSLKTQQKVQQAMDELQYKPDIIARTLATKSPTRLFTLLPYPYQDLYWKKIREGILQGFNEYEPFAIKSHIVFYDLYDKNHFQSIYQSILSPEVDALIIGSDFQKEIIELLHLCHEKEIPVILLSSEINSAPYLSFIGINSYAAGQLAGRIILSTRYLESILTIHTIQDIQNTLHLKNKELGLSEILNESELPFSMYTITLDPVQLSRPDMVDLLAKKIREHNIDTLYVTNSRAHLFAKSIKAIFPEVYIVGHDLIGENMPLLEKELIDVIIDQRGDLQGYLSIKTLVDHVILNKEVAPKQYLPLDIIYPENLPYHTSWKYY